MPFSTLSYSARPSMGGPFATDPVLMAPTKNNNTVLRKSGKSGKQPASTLTREQIEDDLAAFRKAGGKIEKLGNTNTLRKIG